MELEIKDITRKTRKTKKQEKITYTGIKDEKVYYVFNKEELKYATEYVLGYMIGKHNLFLTKTERKEIFRKIFKIIIENKIKKERI